MKKILHFVLLILSLSSYSQIGIGTSTPDASAVLDVSANNKGILIPRVSLSSVNLSSLDGVNSATTGLLIWNSNASVVGGNGVGFYYFNGSIWTKLDSAANTLDEAYDYGGSGAGRTITADTSPVRIDGTDGLLVTGTFGSGTSVEVSGAGTRAFFNPKKSAFRSGYVDGTQWDDANIGNYSFAAGRNTRATGVASMALNEDTLASGQNATSFGRITTASGQNSVAMGTATQASGLNSFATGNNTIASGDNSFTSGTNVEARSFGEVVVGSYNVLNTPVSTTSFNSSDKAFVVGIGVSGSRKDGFKVWKDGRATINDAYTLPSTDGAANSVLVTNGSGTVSWSSDTTSIVSNALFAGSPAYTLVSPTVVDLPNIETSLIPILYNASGNIQIKVIIRYTGTATGLNEFRLRAHDGTTQTFPLTFTDVWTTTATQSGGVVESPWKNWSSSLTNEIHLQGKTTGSMVIQNAYILIKSQ